MTDFGDFLINNMKSSLEPEEIQILKSASFTCFIRDAITNNPSILCTPIEEKEDELIEVQRATKQQQQKQFLMKNNQQEKSHQKSKSPRHTSDDGDDNDFLINQDISDFLARKSTLAAQLDDDNYLIAKSNRNMVKNSAAVAAAAAAMMAYDQGDQQVIVNPIYETDIYFGATGNSHQNKLLHNDNKNNNNNYMHRNDKDMRLSNEIEFKTTNVYEDYIEHANVHNTNAKLTLIKNAATNTKKAAAVSFFKMIKSVRELFNSPNEKNMDGSSNASSGKNLSSLNSSSNHTTTENAVINHTHQFLSHQPNIILHAQNAQLPARHKTAASNPGPVVAKAAGCIMRRQQNFSKKKHVIYKSTTRRPHQPVTALVAATAKRISKRVALSRKPNLNAKLKQRQKSLKIIYDSKVNRIQQKLATSNRTVANRNKNFDKSKEKLLTNWDKVLKKANRNPESFKRLIQSNLRSNRNLTPRGASMVNDDLETIPKLNRLEEKFMLSKTQEPLLINHKVLNSNLNNLNRNKPASQLIQPVKKQPNHVTNMNEVRISSSSKMAINYSIKLKAKARQLPQTSETALKRDLEKNFRNSLITILGSDMKQQTPKKKTAENNEQQKLMLKSKQVRRVLQKISLQSISAKLNEERAVARKTEKESLSFSSWSACSPVIKDEEALLPPPIVLKSKTKQQIQVAAHKEEINPRKRASMPKRIASLNFNTKISVVSESELIQASSLSLEVSNKRYERKAEAAEVAAAMTTTAMLEKRLQRLSDENEKSEKTNETPSSPTTSKNSSVNANHMQMFYFRPESPTTSKTKTMLKNRTQKLIKNVYNHFNQTLSRSLIKQQQQLQLQQQTQNEGVIDPAQLERMQRNLFKTLLKSKQFHNLIPSSFWSVPFANEPSSSSSSLSPAPLSPPPPDLRLEEPIPNRGLNESLISARDNNNNNDDEVVNAKLSNLKKKTNMNLATTTSEEESMALMKKLSLKKKSKTSRVSGMNGEYSNNFVCENVFEAQMVNEYVERSSEIIDNGSVDEIKRNVKNNVQGLEGNVASKETKAQKARLDTARRIKTDGNYYNNNVTVKSSKQLLKELSIGKMAGKNMEVFDSGLSHQRVARFNC